MSNGRLEYSDYVVYVDESGDHSLENVYSPYPIFVLSFCVFQKGVYSDVVAPLLRRIKFSTFGHDMVILHEHDIRKKTGAFSELSKDPREMFLEELTRAIDQIEFVLIAVIIDKSKLKNQNIENTSHCYHLAMQLGLENLYQLLVELGQDDDHLTHLICESRGKVEDIALELEFRRVCDRNNSKKMLLPFEIVIADKKTNSEGLQIADMTARPIGLSYLRPNQPNRALEILEKKFYRNETKEKLGYGLRIYP